MQDIRTPEQIWTDATIDAGPLYPHHSLFYLDKSYYDHLKRRLIERGLEVVTKTFDGQEILVLNDNLYCTL